MAKRGKKLTGEFVLNKIVPVKVDEQSFVKLRSTQKEVRTLISEGERSEEDYEELAIILRSTLTDYIMKLEEFCNNGTSMKIENKVK